MNTVSVTITLPQIGTPQDFADALVTEIAQQSMCGNAIAAHALAQLLAITQMPPMTIHQPSHWWAGSWKDRF